MQVRKKLHPEVDDQMSSRLCTGIISAGYSLLESLQSRLRGQWLLGLPKGWLG